MDNWHISAICEHLQAVATGEIEKLLINVPPGTGKSTIVSVLWPCWVWIRRPETRFMFASYAMNLAQRDARRRRDDVILADWFTPMFGNVIQLEPAQRTKLEYINTRSGHMVASSVGGTITGRRGDILVLDDPHQPDQIESEVQRETHTAWLAQTWSTRRNTDAKLTAEVCIMQRLHHRDASGLFIEDGDWTHLKIPMEYAGRRNKTIIGWEDPRHEKGELVDTKRFTIEDVAKLKKKLGPYGTAGQLQQEPAPEEGGIFKKAWLKSYKWDGEWARCQDWRFNPFEHLRFCIVDPAVSEKQTADYTVISAWAILPTTSGRILCLMDLKRERLEGPDIVPEIQKMHATWKFSIIGVESIAFQLMVFQQAKRAGLPVREMAYKDAEEVLYRIDKDKVARAYGATPLMADGRFYLPENAPWLGEYISELLLFPNADHDDQVDVTSAACAIAEQLRTGVLIKGKPKFKKDWRDAPEFNVKHDDQDKEPSTHRERTRKKRLDWRDEFPV